MRDGGLEGSPGDDGRGARPGLRMLSQQAPRDVGSVRSAVAQVGERAEREQAGGLGRQAGVGPPGGGGHRVRVERGEVRHAPQARARRPHGGTVAAVSRRPSPGLSGTGAVLLALGLGLAGGLVDVLTGPGLATAFAVCFVAGCVLAALRVRRQDLMVVVVAPPLVYTAIALVAGVLSGSSTSGSLLVRHGLDLFTALVLEAPALMLATLLSLLVALARGLLRSRPRTVPAPPPVAGAPSGWAPQPDPQRRERQVF